MSAFLYGVILQWKLDIRSKSLLVTCYLVPLLFFALMGGIFRTVNPESTSTLIQSMSVMGVSMGAFIGLPPSLVEIYASDIKKVYKANGVPLYLGVLTTFLSAFIHLLTMCTIIYLIAPIAFDAPPPASLPAYLGALSVFIAASLSIGTILGLSVKNQSRLTMIAQLVFLPSIMLSGIMFPADMLPRFLQIAGKVFTSTWGYQCMMDHGFIFKNLWPLLAILAASLIVCVVLLKRMKAK